MSVLFSPSATAATAPRPQIDARGPRFGATLTTAVLALVLLTIPSPLATGLLAAQAVVFALGAARGRAGARRTASCTAGSSARTWRRPRARGRRAAAVRPGRRPRVRRRRAASARSPAPRPSAYVAAALALAAAFLNAAFGFCLGCEMYLLGPGSRHRRRLDPRAATRHRHPHRTTGRRGPTTEGAPHEPRRPYSSTPTGSRPISTTRRSSWSRSTRTPRPTTRATSRAP